MPEAAGAEGNKGSIEMLRRGFLKLLGAAIAVPIVGWAPKRLAPDRWNVWTGRISGNWSEPRNWLLGRVPASGDSVVFNSCSGSLTENLSRDEMRCNIDTLVVADKFAATIGSQGRTL